MTHLARLGAVFVAVLVVALGTASCTGAGSTEPESESSDAGAPVVQLGGPGEPNRTLSPEEVEELASPMWTEADVEFVEMMIPHHEQALEMAALVPDRAGDPGLRTMVERMEVSQTDEVQQLEDWLSTTLGSDAGQDHGSHDGSHDGAHADMPGMLTPEQLDELASLEGRAFDRYFLQAMINHHDGAIRMVQTLMDGGEGGQEATIFQLANHIGSDQAVEIAAMKRRLKALGG